MGPCWLTRDMCPETDRVEADGECKVIVERG